MKKRRCRHNPLEARKLKRETFKKGLFKDMGKLASKYNLPVKTTKELQDMLGIIEGLSRDGANWNSFRKFARLLIQKLGYGTASKLRNWLCLLDPCLEVELGCAYPAEMKRFDREWRKNNPLPKLPKSMPAPGPSVYLGASMGMTSSAGHAIDRGKAELLKMEGGAE